MFDGKIRKLGNDLAKGMEERASELRNLAENHPEHANVLKIRAFTLTDVAGVIRKITNID